MGTIYSYYVSFIGITYRYYIEITPIMHRSHSVRESQYVNKQFYKALNADYAAFNLFNTSSLYVYYQFNYLIINIKKLNR